MSCCTCTFFQLSHSDYSCFQVWIVAFVDILIYRSRIVNIINMCNTNYEYSNILEYVLNLFDTDDIFKIRSIQIVSYSDYRAAVAGRHTGWVPAWSRVVTVSSRIPSTTLWTNIVSTSAYHGMILWTFSNGYLTLQGHVTFQYFLKGWIQFDYAPTTHVPKLLQLTELYPHSNFKLTMAFHSMCFVNKMFYPRFSFHSYIAIPAFGTWQVATEQLQIYLRCIQCEMDKWNKRTLLISNHRKDWITMLLLLQGANLETAKRVNRDNVKIFSRDYGAQQPRQIMLLRFQPVPYVPHNVVLA